MAQVLKSVKIKSYSKINLSLRILDKLKSGMHNIETNSTLINIYDELTIKINKKDETVFKGRFKEKVNSKKNSILLSLKLLRKMKLIKDNYKVIIKKNIPVFSGLGGGTSNAYSILKYFLKNKVNQRLIGEFEKKIGSDFRLFQYKHSVQQKLKKVSKSDNRLNLNLIIVYPHINCKTASIYKMVNKFSKASINRYLKKMNSNKFIEMLIKDKNDLQELVEKKYPSVLKLINTIHSQNGCIISRMTGSGSACFGVFKSKKTAKQASNKLKKIYPKYWCVTTKTI